MRDGEIWIAAAGDDNRRKWERLARDWRKIFKLFGSVFAVHVSGRNQQCAFDLVDLSRRCFAPVGQRDAALAVRGKNDGGGRLLYLRRYSLQPPFLVRKFPISLLHTQKDGVLLFP